MPPSLDQSVNLPENPALRFVHNENPSSYWTLIFSMYVTKFGSLVFRYCLLCLTLVHTYVGVLSLATVGMVDLLLHGWYKVKSEQATPRISPHICDIVSWAAATKKKFPTLPSSNWKYNGIEELPLLKSDLRVLLCHSAVIIRFLIFLRHFPIFFLIIYWCWTSSEL